MTNKDAIKLGFEPIPHYTVHDSHVYNLPRNRFLSFGCIGTPNEMLAIGERSGNDVTDLIVLHNYDYDGLMNQEKLQNLINILS